MQKEGGWVFISHSHHDIEKVREIRNELEKNGFEPLMFFLKCLTDDDEVEALIKREINEREWFIYADSENARNSKWVQSERKYIHVLPDKKVYTVDLEKEIVPQVKEIVRQLKVFVSYSKRDHPVADRIMKCLVKNDFLVLSDNDLTPGCDFVKAIDSMIDQAAKEGFVLQLISEASLRSHWVAKESQTTAFLNGKTVYIVLGDPDIDEQLKERIENSLNLKLSADPDEQEIEKIVQYIKRQMNYKNSSEIYR